MRCKAPPTSLAGTLPPPYPIAHRAPVSLSPVAFKLPRELLALLKQRGTTLEDMMREFPECIYMGEFVFPWKRRFELLVDIVS